MIHKKAKKKYHVPVNPNTLKNYDLNKKTSINFKDTPLKEEIKANIYTAEDWNRSKVEIKNNAQKIEEKFKFIDPISKWLVSRNGRIFLGGVLVLALANGAYKSIQERKREQ